MSDFNADGYWKHGVFQITEAPPGDVFEVATVPDVVAFVNAMLEEVYALASHDVASGCGR